MASAFLRLRRTGCVASIRVETVYHPEEAPRPIEIIDALQVTVRNSYAVPWSYRPILEADTEIIERSLRPSIKIDGLPFKTCQRVHDLCGPDPAADIPALEQALTTTKFSKDKRAKIVAAYEAEAEARQSDTPAVTCLIEFFVAAGEKRANARDLAQDFDPALGPYQFLFSKRQSFIKADQFAKIYDPARRETDRPMALIVRELLDTLNIVNRVDVISHNAWKSFEQSSVASKAAIEQLEQRAIIRKVEGGLIGLDWLVRAEEAIAAFLMTNVEYELSEQKLSLIDYVLDHAAKFLRRPDFVPTPEQRAAVINAFLWLLSIITGPPGVGKTAVLALINAVASMLYAEEEFPTWVIALAGRAASNARELGTCWTPWGGETSGRSEVEPGDAARSTERPRRGGMIPLHATTIHRGLGLQSEGDDGPDAFKTSKQLKCGVLGIEKISMISSPLLAAITKSARARHFVLVGDQNQLPPIGPGKPLKDALAAACLPTTQLTKNWRTDCQGLRDLCADMLTLDKAELQVRFPDYVKAGVLSSSPAIGTNGHVPPQ